MILIGQDKIEIYEEQENAAICGTDNYGHPKKCMVFVEVVEGSFQPQSNLETKEQFGDAVQDSAVIIIPVDSNITPTSKVKPLEKVYGGFWAVAGTPKVYNTLIPHIEVDIIKER